MDENCQNEKKPAVSVEELLDSSGKEGKGGETSERQKSFFQSIPVTIILGLNCSPGAMVIILKLTLLH